MCTISILVLFSLLSIVNLCAINDTNLCNYQHKHKFQECNIESSNFSSRQCATINFSGNEKFKNNLGTVKLQKSPLNNAVNITFSQVTWNKAYLKLSAYNNSDRNVCKMISIGKKLTLPRNLYDDCILHAIPFKAKHYLLEIKMELKHEISTRKLLFPSEESLFYYIEFSDNNLVFLSIPVDKLDPLPTKYKIEIFKENDNVSNLIDVRVLGNHANGDEVVFEYTTFNEEGLYYFKISIINLKCPEDFCPKTISPKIYISRKGAPLVIGIVGASCMIPFILFLFYMLSKKRKEFHSTEQILFIYQHSSIESHNEVVALLSKLIKDLTRIDTILMQPNKSKKWCQERLHLATHFVYVSPPKSECDVEVDAKVSTFLIEDHLDKPPPTVMVVSFPYSSIEIPAIFSNALRFELMDEFEKLLIVLNCVQTDFGDNNYNVQLLKKIQNAKFETECRKVPKIVITDDCSDPGEADELL